MVEERELNKILAVQVMESFGVAVAMDDGRFSVKPNVEDGMYYPDLQSMNLSQLTNEFFASDGMKTSYLEKNIEDKILPMAEENLFLLPSGIVPPNPSELIGSAKSTYLLSVLKKKFDVVIIDSSPIVSASDALLLSQLVDGVVLVIESGATNRTLVKDVVQQLKMAKANIIGVVLNRADIGKGSYYTY
jgi:capsular exopolysaccharide synthesis family protein